MATYAQWSEPELPTAASTLVAGHKYQVRNVEANQYVGSGTAYFLWTTATTLVERDSEDLITYIIDDTTDDYGTGWTFVNAASGKYTFISGGGSLEGHEGFGEMHVDMGVQGHNHFDISLKDGSTTTYRIKVASTDDTYGDGTGYSGYWGWISDDEIYTQAVFPFLDPDESNFCCDWELIDMTEYSARVILYETLEESQEYDNVDAGAVSSASSIYNNNSSTLEQIEAATAALNQAITDVLTQGASKTHPVDVTSLIVNNDFSTGDITGWTCTFVSGVTATDVGYQSDSYVNTSYVYTNHEEKEMNPFISGFIQAWSAGQRYGENTSVTRNIGDAELSQTLTGLPEGQYKLAADVIAVQQDNTGLTVSGVQLFATGGDIDNYESISTGDGVPEHIELTFLSTGGDVTLGLRTVYTDANWIAADNFELMYYGEFEESAYYTILQNSVEEAADYTDTGTYHYSSAMLEKLESAIETAENLLDGTATDDELIAGNDSLQAVLETVKTDIEAYTSFASYIETMASDMAIYDESGYTDISDTLSDLYDEVSGHYSDCDLSAEEIRTYIDGYKELLVALVTEAMPTATADKPLDITILGTNMDYADNSDSEGWTIVTSGSYNVTYHTAEVWNTTFSCLQTLNNMLAGSYTMTAKALYRTADNQTCYTDYINGTGEVMAYLVLASSTSPVVNQAAGAIVADEAPYSGYAELSSNPGVWVPNSMQAAEYAFNLNDTYDCEISGYLMEDGDLTFGIRNDGPVSGDAWSIWTQFRLYYCGTSSSIVYDNLQELMAEAEELQDEVGPLVEVADEKFNAALSSASEVLPNTPEEEIRQAIDEVQAAIDYANESLSLISILMEKYEAYDALMYNVISSDDSFVGMMDDLSEAVLDEVFVSNEQMQKWIEDLITGWTSYVQYDHLDATIDEPGDISAAILNADFEGISGGSTSQFWDITISGGTQSGEYNAYECYNNDAFTVSQTIKGLAEGYYRVRVQALYRAGTNDINASSLESDPDYGQYVMFAANTVTVPICNVVSGGNSEATGAGGETSVTYNGSTVYIPNSMESFAAYTEIFPDRYWNEVDVHVANGTLTIQLRKAEHLFDDWTIWNEFQLLYLGTEMPTGIDSLPDSDVANDTSAATVIYSIDGKRLSSLAKCINIVKTTMADGTVNVRKVLIK
ncbi:MAG: hypothetical protein LUC44_00445 [Prevotellaceae bacterium]|nr:hypothetical protein [Prevotellaceae bacterium]